MNHWLTKLTFAIALTGGCALNSASAALMVPELSGTASSVSMDVGSESDKTPMPWIDQNARVTDGMMGAPSISSSNSNTFAPAAAIGARETTNDNLVALLPQEGRAKLPDAIRLVLPKPPKE